MAEDRDETQVLLPEDVYATLSDGTKVKLRPLKARQFFKLLRIITRGASGLLQEVDLGAMKDPEQFGAQLVGLIVFAFPEAPDATFEFLVSMVEFPVNKKGNLTDEGARIYQMITDPEIEDVLNMVEAIVAREREDLVALGNRVRAMIEVAGKTGQLKPQPPETDSSAPTPEPSTSSAPSTDGPMTPSSTSPSDESDKPPPVSGNGERPKTEEPVAT